jgi:hypothetical protein
MLEQTVTAVPRIRVRRASDVPPGAVRVFGAVLWRNKYSYRSRYGLARVPAAESDAPWEYEGRISAAGMRHDFFHPEGHKPPVTFCTVRYMTRYECQETFRRVLTGELTPALAHHAPLVSVPEVVEALKGKTLACTCPFPAKGQQDWCHAGYLAWLAAVCDMTRLTCLTETAAKAVAREADRPGINRTVAFGKHAFISYCDKRYPLDVAEWAFDHDHADDDAASAVIASL